MIYRRYINKVYYHYYYHYYYYYHHYCIAVLVKLDFQDLGYSYIDYPLYSKDFFC